MWNPFLFRSFKRHTFNQLIVMSEKTDSQTKSRKKSYQLSIKIAIIGFITLILLLPSSKIRSLIDERQDTKDEAAYNISQKWGNSQTIAGPLLTIPYSDEIDYWEDGSKHTSKTRKLVHILPDQLIINSELIPETLNRGIYEIAVYDSQSTLKGVFNNVTLSDLVEDTTNLLLDEAFISIGVSDLRGLKEHIDFNWGAQQYKFESGLSSLQNNKMGNAISAKVPVSITNDELDEISFKINLRLNGSKQLFFTPSGSETEVTMTSTWNSPSFQGNYLPNADSKEISDAGFKASWNVIDLNRSLPKAWFDKANDLMESKFGVHLFIPTDNYQQSERSIKYSILLIGLTFLIFFCTEIVNKASVHPIQYLFVGTALIIFYLLLVSLSEHISFSAAYMISVISTVTLTAFYTHAIFHVKRFTIILTAILTALYSFIFVIIQLENFALLAGSIGLFLILAGIMFYTRKINWNSLDQMELV